MTRRVDFLIAGAQKAGTSALFEYLREVPALQLPAIKEVHFFDDEALDWASPDYALYHRHFVDDGRLWGEATPITIYWPNALERAARYNLAMKIVVLLRNPIQRAWSHWQMEYAKSKETEPFAWCIREGRARVAQAGGEAPGYQRVFSYVERGFYGAQLERLYGLFPRDQLLLLRSEHLAGDPDGVVGQICGFLGIRPPSAPLRQRRVREAPAIAYPSDFTDADRDYLGRLYAADMEHVARITGWDLSAWS